MRSLTVEVCVPSTSKRVRAEKCSDTYYKTKRTNFALLRRVALLRLVGVGRGHLGGDILQIALHMCQVFDDVEQVGLLAGDTTTAQCAAQFVNITKHLETYIVFPATFQCEQRRLACGERINVLH